MNSATPSPVASYEELFLTADRVAARLLACGKRVVLAESCTAGLISASLSRTPGISSILCGSAVVYQEATKTAWLGVSAHELTDPAIGPVSRQTAVAMALGVLRETPAAEWSASITGHLGPEAPPALDGVAYVALAHRESSKVSGLHLKLTEVHRLQLPGDASEPSTLRVQRQVHAAGSLLQLVEAAVTRQPARE